MWPVAVRWLLPGTTGVYSWSRGKEQPRRLPEGRGMTKAVGSLTDTAGIDTLAPEVQDE